MGTVCLVLGDIPGGTRPWGAGSGWSPTPFCRVHWQQTHHVPQAPPLWLPPRPHPGLVPVCLLAIAHGDNRQR